MGMSLENILELPANPHNVLVFAYGSGSEQLSPRNTFVARRLQQDGLAILLLDLLIEEEADDRRNVFNINLPTDGCYWRKAGWKQNLGHSI